MRPDTVIRHRRAIARALAYCSAEFGRAPTLAEIADAVAMSPYHFARVYEGFVGESVVRAVRRRRLHDVQDELTAGGEKIAVIAGHAGYRSGQAFARALKRSIGLTPTRARQTEWSNASGQPFALNVVDLPERPAWGVPFHGSVVDETAAFEEMIGHAYADGGLESISAIRRTVQGMTLLNHGWESDAPSSRIALLVADGLPRRFGGFTIPGGRYAVFDHHGGLESATKAVTIVRQQLLGEFGLVVTDKPILREWVVDALLLPANRMHLRIYLPV
jgi:AraC-like DNA-binding protein